MKECTNIIHKETVEKVKNKLLDDDKIVDISELFKVFADSTRVKIINALLENELCVCDLTYLINSTQSAVSHQLRILKSSKLIKYRKVGKVVYYSIADDHVKEIFLTGKEHIDEV